MKAMIYPNHRKTIIYIVPVGKDNIEPLIIDCDCQETKGVDHLHAQSKKI